MKLNISRSLGSSLIAITCLTGALIAPTPLMAQAPAAVLKSSSLTAKVTVPSNKDAVSYKLKGKKVTIEPGTTAEIPADAKSIKLPEGVKITITTVPSEAGATSSAFTFLVTKAVTLGTLSGNTFKAKSSSFQLLYQTGDIKLPSKTMADLMDVAARISSNPVNPFTVLQGDDVTDGN